MELRADLWIWDIFLESYNGPSLWMAGLISNMDMVLQVRQNMGHIFKSNGVLTRGPRNGIQLVCKTKSGTFGTVSNSLGC